MLHTLGKSVVGTLSDTDFIDRIERFAVIALKGLVGILTEEFTTTQHFHHHTVELFGEHLVVFFTCFVGFLGDKMKICGGTKVGKAGIGSVFCQGLGDGIHGKRHLYMKSTIQVGITSNRKSLTRVQVQKPIFDERGFCKKITSCLGTDFIRVFARRLFDFHGEGNGTTGFTGNLDKTLPNHGTVKVKSNNVGSKSHENKERSHGRTSTQKDEVLVLQINPTGVVNASNNCFTSTGFNSTVFDPFVNFCAEFFAVKILTLVGNFKAVRRLGLGSLDESRKELFAILGFHGIFHGSDLGSGYIDEFKSGMCFFETSLCHSKSCLGTFTLFVDHTDKVFDVSKSPILKTHDFAGLFRTSSFDGSGQNSLGSGCTGTFFLSIILDFGDRPYKTTWRRRSPGKSFLEGRLAIGSHVHDHGKSTRGINDREGHNKVVHDVFVSLSQEGKKYGILGSREEDSQFTSDSSGVQDSK
mmetsp:Transcript_17657/g.27243  ORF Transcript_17657/g.27243 Transcript_17657/m.27243 type:complete len:469 (+) Transcript_17657:700-2106(+)